MIIFVAGNFSCKLLEVFYDFQDKFCNFSPASDELLSDLDEAHGETVSGPILMHDIEMMIRGQKNLDRNPWKIMEYFSEIFEYITDDLQQKLAKKNKPEISQRLELWHKVSC